MTSVVASVPTAHSPKRRKLPDMASPRTPRTMDAPGVDPRTTVVMAFLVAVTRVIVQLAHKDERDELLALRHIGLWDFYRVVLSEAQQRIYIRNLTHQLEQLGYTTKHVENELRALGLHWDATNA